MDTLITNIPWGRQIETSIRIIDLMHNFLLEAHRVLVKTGKLVLLTNQPELISAEHFNIERSIEISLFGQKPTVAVMQIGVIL